MVDLVQFSFTDSGDKLILEIDIALTDIAFTSVS